MTTIIIIHMPLGSTAPIATRRHPPHQGCCRFRPGFSFGAVLWPDAHRHGRHIAGINGRLPRLGESNVRIAPIHPPRRRSGLPFTLALPITTILTSVPLTAMPRPRLDGRQDERESASPRQRSERSDRGRRAGPSLRTGAALPGVSGFITPADSQFLADEVHTACLRRQWQPRCAIRPRTTAT